AAEARMRTILTTVPGAAEAGVLDAGSGSGAIAIGLASRLAGSGTRVTALEGSPHAWPYLLRNVARSGLPIEPRFGRIGDPRPLGGARYALIASNPPYIPEACLPLDPEVRLFDPEPALYSGPDGLDAVRVLVRFAARRLLPGGAILLEHDERQGRSVRALLDAAGLVQSRTEADLNGRDRVSSALRAR
ncbi:MAG: peptide chain release factor N(5)-glutamine methyltransferase, partial [Pseudoclavibacter sp.]|nr:peptide chain release factor N(5)-glutamine methyltransferase [Pseudoclavibacter sp.]